MVVASRIAAASSLCAAPACGRDDAGDKLDQRTGRGGTLIIAIEEQPPGLNTVTAPTLGTAMIASNLFSQLVRLSPTLEPTPDLADRWDVSADGLVYRFRLNPRARWHDGRPVTADDAVFSFQELNALSPRASSWVVNVESFNAEDPHTFVIRLKRPFAPLLAVLGDINSNVAIYPRHRWPGPDHRANREQNQAPTGSGPFRFSSWVRGRYVELLRNPTYFKPGLPKLDRLIIQFTPDRASREIAFEGGEVDFLYSYLVPINRLRHFRADPRFTVVEGGLSSATNLFLLFNTQNPSLHNVAVRRAIAHAIDRRGVTDKALFGEGRIAQSALGSAIRWAYTPVFDRYGYDPATAERLLDSAGLLRNREGKRFPLRLANVVGTPAHDRTAEMIQSNLADVGIDARIDNADVAAFLEAVFAKHDFDLALQLFTTGPDPTISVPHRYRQSTIGQAYANAMQYVNPELESLLLREPSILNQDQRAGTWRRIQEILGTDVPVLPLFEVPAIQLVSSRFCEVVSTGAGYLDTRERARLARHGRC